MELFKMMEADDRRNKSCKSTLKRKSVAATSNGPLQLCLTYIDETTVDEAEEPENFSLRKLLERKLAVFKVLYPFLPLDQIKGKVLQSLHLPPKWDSKVKDAVNLNISSLDPLMMTDYSNYFIHLLTTLNHTVGPMKVANETLAQVVVGAAKTPKTQETSTNKFDFFSPPIASETSEKKKSTPSVMIPLGERNCNQNTAEIRETPVKRKSMFIVRSVAGTSDNASEIADSIILPPSKVRRIAKKVVHSTPMRPPVTKPKDCPSVSSIGTVENQMLPPTPPRKKTRSVKSSPRSMLPPANRTRARPGTPMRPIQCHSPSLSVQTCEDSIIVNLKFHAVTKSPPPKLRNTAKSGGNESEVTMKGFMESSTKQLSAFDYLSEEDEADQLGLPLTDYMSKVHHFLKTAQPDQPEDEVKEEEEEEEV